MSYEVLARKWRPHDFQGMVGQSHVVQALVNALDTDRVHHAYLFTGTRGVGKTTLARILAKCLNCEKGVSSRPCGVCTACTEIDQGRFFDLLEVDAASRAKVDETRELMDNVQFAPSRGRYKVYLIDEVHMFSTHSFNALLKTLEEPPPHVKFLLATTDPQKLPVTVLSRCLQFNLRRLPVDQIDAALVHILDEEGIGFEADGIRLIARAADGSMRDALSLLDQAIAFGGGFVSAENVRSMLGTVERHHVYGLLDALASDDGGKLLEIAKEMSAVAVEFSSALGDLLSILQRIATLQLVPQVEEEFEEERESLVSLAQTMTPEDVQLYYQIGLVGLRDLPFSPDPRGGFEMILLRMLAFRPTTGPAIEPPPRAPTERTVEGKRTSPERPVTPPTGRGEHAENDRLDSGTARISDRTWSQTVSALSVSGLVKELATNTTFSYHQDGVVELVLAASNAQLNRKTVTDKLQDAMTAYLGQSVQLRVVIGDVTADTPAAETKKASDQRREAALSAIENDPKVVALREAFDAVIDQDSIRPVDPSPND